MADEPKPYGDNEDFSWGGAMFRASMSRCDDCDAQAPLEWWGRHIRICASCAARRALEGAAP